MPAHDPAHAEDSARHRNLYDATMERAMQAGAIEARFDALGAKIDALAASVDKRFEQIDKRFEQVDRRLEALENRFFYLQLTLIGGLGGVIATLLASPL